MTDLQAGLIFDLNRLLMQKIIKEEIVLTDMKNYDARHLNCGEQDRHGSELGDQSEYVEMLKDVWTNKKLTIL